MTGLTSKPRALSFLLTELPGNLSRDNVTILSGSGILEAGTVLAKVTASSKYVPAVATASDGSQTGFAVLGYRVDATSSDVPGVVVANDAEVKDSMLIFHASVNDSATRAAKLTQLRAVNIKSR